MKPSRPASPAPTRPRPALWTRDEELWFEDGNLILRAGEVEFKVYQGPLAAHSPVFDDMLSLPQPDGEPVYKERSLCPVVNLSDSPEDLRHFLRTFVCGRTLR